MTPQSYGLPHSRTSFSLLSSASHRSQVSTLPVKRSSVCPASFVLYIFFSILVIIFVKSTLGRSILKALGYLNDLENVSVFCRVVNLLLKKLVSHLLFGCTKRESVTHNWITGGKVMIARVVRVSLHLKGGIQEVYVFFIISHNAISIADFR